jgi:hypothetical protein
MLQSKIKSKLCLPPLATCGLGKKQFSKPAFVLGTMEQKRRWGTDSLSRHSANNTGWSCYPRTLECCP